MGFITNSATNTAATKRADRNEAKGFLNIYLPTAGGGRKKLGSLPLRESYRTEAQVLAQLKDDPQAVGRLVEALEVEFNPYDPNATDNEVVF